MGLVCRAPLALGMRWNATLENSKRRACLEQSGAECGTKAFGEWTTAVEMRGS